MGSFSWLKADKLTKTCNVYEGCAFRFLVPKEFGGRSFIEYYQGYGHLGSRYDMYELLAFWNYRFKLLNGKSVLDYLNWQGKEVGAPIPFMKEIDEFTNENRGIGIDIGCYDTDIKRLKYPLKLVSFRNSQTYEECDMVSLNDPHQGFYPVTWEQLEKDRIKDEKNHKNSILQQIKEEVEIMRTTLYSLEKDKRLEKGLTDGAIDSFLLKYAAEKENLLLEHNKL